MLRDHVGVVFLLLLSLLSPDRPPPREAPVPDPPVPNLAGLCNWGQIDQSGRKFVVFGHAHWTAEGEIVRDGKIVVMWIETATGRLAPGEYRIGAHGKVAGKWDWLETAVPGDLHQDDVLKDGRNE